MVLIRVLGAVEITDGDGRTTPVAGRRPSLLLAVLAEHAPETMTTARLAEALWGDDLPVDPAGALQSQVARLRRRLGSSAVIETVVGGYRLTGADVDTRAFERRLRAADGADSATAFEELDAALQLWRGPAFCEHRDHPELRGPAARLEESRIRAAEARAAALLDLERLDEATAAAAALVGAQPLREAPHALLARCLAASGCHAQALDVLRTFTRSLGEEVGLTPSAELVDLERRILRHEPLGLTGPSRRSAAPAWRGAPRLPEFATSFIGRDHDLATLHALLASHRLVTVVGAGGVGKTRLAVEAARSLPRGAFPDGTGFVDLAAVRWKDGVVAAVATTLGLERVSGSDAQERLVDALSTRRTLLVLDNCEHVIGAAVDLVDAVISGTSSTTVLATSRERLGMGAEHCHVVRPLSTPEADRCEGAAAELFLDRAQASLPGFAPTAGDEVAVCELCRRVEGLPLGIELIAMLLSSRAPIEILADLSARSAPPQRRGGDERHRSMDAVLSWSYDLLEDADRDLFEHLAVFAGGFAREAAASVTGLDAGETAQRLGGLVDRSLVTAESTASSTRHRLLEPIRAFAEDCLEQRGRLGAARRRHATWVAAMVDRAATGLMGPDEAVWSRRLGFELGNLRAAVRHLGDIDDGAACLRILAPLYWYVWSGAHSEIATWAEEAVMRWTTESGDEVPDVCAVAANGAWQRGDLGAAGRLARRGVDAAGGDNLRARRALDAWGDVSSLLGENLESVRLYGEALEGARRAGDRRQIVIGTANLALAHGYAGDAGRAVVLADEALDLARDSGNPSNVAMATYVRGEVVLEAAPDVALPLLDAAIAAAERAANRFLTGVAAMSAISLAARTRDPRDALHRYPPLIEHWQRVGAWTQLWTTLRTLIETLVRAGCDEPAVVLLGALRATRRAAPLVGADATRLGLVENELRARLGHERFQRLLSQGAVMGDAEAIALALDVSKGFSTGFADELGRH